ncbi:MAG: hypothetical protein EBR30_09995 [Cytophagia bacterium]|nr:hypothetical protein [Cytophagia bacterium]
MAGSYNVTEVFKKVERFGYVETQLGSCIHESSVDGRHSEHKAHLNQIPSSINQMQRSAIHLHIQTKQFSFMYGLGVYQVQA